MRELLSYSFIMPPTVFILSCLIGAFLALAYPRTGRIIVLISSITLYLCCTPAVTTLLEHQLLSRIPRQVNLKAAQAIVIPSIDMKWSHRTDVQDTVGVLTLARLASAARLYRELQ